MDLREALLQAGNQIKEILKWQIGMQPADDVKFGDRFAVARGGGLEGFVERHRIRAGRIFLPSEGAKAAGGHANIRRIDVAIDVEISLVAMHALAHGIRQPAYGEDVRRTVECERVVLGQPFSSEDLS